MTYNNKRINYKDIALQGGYVLAYNDGINSVIELRIDDFFLKDLDNYILEFSFEKIKSKFKDERNKYFDGSFLPLTEKESAKKELLADVRAVAKSLESHFS